MPTTSPAPRGGLLRRAGGLCALLLAGCAAQAPAPSPGRAGTPADSAAWSLPGFPHASTPAVRGHRASEVIWTRLREGFALPDLDHPAVRRELDWYTAHPLFLEAMWARAERYLFYILGETDRRGLPTELALLPVVESGFRPQAVSPSAAAGLWQFIPGTGTHLGLRQDDWVDQRMDVLRSTAAALDYLTSLRDSFDGDWLLALAAYNGGPGYVGRLQEANRRSSVVLKRACTALATRVGTSTRCGPAGGVTPRRRPGFRAITSSLLSSSSAASTSRSIWRGIWITSKYCASAMRGSVTP